MSQRRDLSRLLLTLILLAYVVLAVWYSYTIPLGEAPDEVPHFTYVRYLAQHGRLPTTTEEHEAFQPPLYYVTGAALTFWIEDVPDAPFAVRANAHFDVADPRAPKNLLLHTSAEAWPYRGWALAWHLVRLLSIFLGAVTVWAVYQLGRLVFPQQPAIPLTMAALTAFTPQFLFMSAVINNDNAATAFSALVLWQVAALLQDAERSQIRKRSLVLGLLLGLGVLSKANLIALLPIVGLAILVTEVRRAGWVNGLRSAVVSGLLAFGLAALLAAWYFVRNWLNFGDPMGWSFLLEINAQREGPLTLDVLAWLSRGVFRSFWFGWIGVEYEDVIYWTIGILCLVGVMGFVVWLVQRWRALDAALRWTLGLLGLHVVITLASLVQWTATVLGTDQGRLIYPLLPTGMLVLAGGWSCEVPLFMRGWAKGRARNWALGGLAAGMLVLAILTPIRYLGPLHAPAPAATEAELGASTSLNLDWGDIRLLGYRLEGNQVRPGEKLILDLYWQANDSIEQDIQALIQLVDQDERFLMYTDGSPSAGRDTTDRWKSGVPLASRHLLLIPDYGQPGEYHLTISLHPFGEQTWLPVTGPDGTLLGDKYTLPETVHITP